MHSLLRLKQRYEGWFELRCKSGNRTGCPLEVKGRNDAYHHFFPPGLRKLCVTSLAQFFRKQSHAKRNNDAILPLVLSQRWKFMEKSKGRGTQPRFYRDQRTV